MNIHYLIEKNTISFYNLYQEKLNELFSMKP